MLETRAWCSISPLRCRALGSRCRGAPARRNDQRWQVSADPSYTYGPPELCVSKVAAGTFWFQTTDPRYSRKLDQRQDTRRVAVTGVNHYRRTYEMRGNWRKVKRIVRRYVKATNDMFSSRIPASSASKIAGRVRTAANRKRRLQEVAGQC
jgi:hypothetical protein